MRYRPRRWWLWRNLIWWGSFANGRYLISITPRGVGFGWWFYGVWFTWRGKRGSYWN